MMFTRLFWKDAAERAVSTGAQAALLVVGQDLAGVDLFAMSPANIAGAFLGGAFLAVLKCLAFGGKGGTISPGSAVKP